MYIRYCRSARPIAHRWRSSLRRSSFSVWKAGQYRVQLLFVRGIVHSPLWIKIRENPRMKLVLSVFQSSANDPRRRIGTRITLISYADFHGFYPNKSRCAGRDRFPSPRQPATIYQIQLHPVHHQTVANFHRPFVNNHSVNNPTDVSETNTPQKTPDCAQSCDMAR